MSDAQLADRILRAVRRHADTALADGRDPFHGTPLFVDGLDVGTHEPPHWKLDGEDLVLSNQANCQHLYRTLDGLSALTGDPAYREAAVAAIRHAFEHCVGPTGLLFQGQHVAFDLRTRKMVSYHRPKDADATERDRIAYEYLQRYPEYARGERPAPDADRRYPNVTTNWNRTAKHEMKLVFPHYALMHAAAPEATERFVDAFWDAHILDWSNLHFTRHGRYDQPFDDPWTREYVGGPLLREKNYAATFANTATDLIHAAGLLSAWRDDPRPLAWAERLAHRYEETRYPTTGLGAYMFTRYHGKEGTEQFAPEVVARFGPGSGWLDPSPPEGYIHRYVQILQLYQMSSRYGVMPTCLLRLAERLGARGEPFRRMALADLDAWATHAYSAEDNRVYVMLLDGTRLTPEVVLRPGPLGRPEQFPKSEPVGGRYLLALAAAHRATGDARWEAVARNIIDAPDDRSDDALFLVALLELHASTGDRALLDRAVSLGGAMLDAHVHHGLFVPDANRRFTRICSPLPVALLRLAATLRGRGEDVREFWPGTNMFQCDYDGVDGITDGACAWDDIVIYGQTRT